MNELQLRILETTLTYLANGDLSGFDDEDLAALDDVISGAQSRVKAEIWHREEDRQAAEMFYTPIRERNLLSQEEVQEILNRRKETGEVEESSFPSVRIKS